MSSELKTGRFWIAVLAMLIGAMLLVMGQSTEFAATLIVTAVGGWGLAWTMAKRKEG